MNWACRQPAGHLAGRFLTPTLIEVPSQLFEQLLMQPTVLSRICLHPATSAPLPAGFAGNLAAYFGSRYGSALAMSARVAAGLAEQMYGQFGGDGENYWRGCWQAVSWLPEPVAVAGCLQEVGDVNSVFLYAAHK
jgi:Zn-dependent oligopeptidase